MMSSEPEFPRSYYVVRESRPLINTPLVSVRYLTSDGRLDSNPVVANRFDSNWDAVCAMFEHAKKIADRNTQHPAPPETKLEVIRCEFYQMREISLAEAIDSEKG